MKTLLKMLLVAISTCFVLSYFVALSHAFDSQDPLKIMPVVTFGLGCVGTFGLMVGFYYLSKIKE